MNELGPFQAIWQAWDDANDSMVEKPLEHFRIATEHQFKEIETHLEKDDVKAAAREAIDIVSIALNFLRKLEYEPADVAEIAQDRADHRMRGQVHEILEKYNKLYGI